MVRNTWFRCPITSMKGKKSNSAEIKLLNVHVVEDLRICDKYSHVTLLVVSKHKIKYQIVQILPTEVSFNIKIAQFVDAGKITGCQFEELCRKYKSFFL